MTIITFTKIDGPYGWMSNMSAHPVCHDGVDYRTAEALFQALRFADADIRQVIRTERSPMAAKMAAKKYAVHVTVEPRSPVDLANMELVVCLKMEQHPHLAAALDATGDAVLVEDVGKRRHSSNLFWGAYLDGDRLVGDNHLGQILMTVRAVRRTTTWDTNLNASHD